MYGKAMLFGDQATAQKILEAKEPREQKALGRAVQNFDTAVWQENAKKIVYKANFAKFSQNPEIKKILDDVFCKDC